MSDTRPELQFMRRLLTNPHKYKSEHYKDLRGTYNLPLGLNPLTPNNGYNDRTAPVTYKRCILYTLVFIQQI